jgi:hypothetical protein
MAAFRFTGDFFVSPTADATKDFIRRQQELGEATLEPYVRSGALMDSGPSLGFYTPHENYSTGIHHETVFRYDPWDPFSVEQTRKMMAEMLNPKGKFRSLATLPGMGGSLQVESVHHVHQNWGPLYDNYDVWLRKIKQMLDPNNVADWSSYIPPVVP